MESLQHETEIDKIPVLSRQSTRWEILQIIKRQGQATVEGLARELGVSLMAVRLHLMALERDGLLSREPLRSGPGRPTLIYRPTDRAEDVFPKSYHILADRLLDGLRQEAGDGQVQHACSLVADALVQSYRHRMAGKDLEGRLAEWRRIQTAEGCAVDWERTEGGYRLYSYTCPYFRVAQRHREVCDLDLQLLVDLLAVEAERTESLVDGAARCAYRLSALPPGA